MDLGEKFVQFRSVVSGQRDGPVEGVGVVRRVWTRVAEKKREDLGAEVRITGSPRRGTVYVGPGLTPFSTVGRHHAYPYYYI